MRIQLAAVLSHKRRHECPEICRLQLLSASGARALARRSLLWLSGRRMAQTPAYCISPKKLTQRALTFAEYST